jgi:hypothetical protein
MGTLVRMSARSETIGHQRVLLVGIEQKDLSSFVSHRAAFCIDDPQATRMDDNDHEVDVRVIAAVVVQADGTAAVNAESVETQPLEGDTRAFRDLGAEFAREGKAEMRAQRIELTRFLCWKAVGTQVAGDLEERFKGGAAPLDPLPGPDQCGVWLRHRQ